MYSDMPCPNFTTLGKWGLRQLLDMILNWSTQKIASLVLVVVMKSVALPCKDGVAGWLTAFCNKTVVQVVWWIHFFYLSLVLVSWQAYISSIVMKLGFITQPSSNSTLPFAGLQHMQQCQVGWYIPLSLFAPGFWSKWMVHEKWSPQRGFEPTTSQA